MMTAVGLIILACMIFMTCVLARATWQVRKAHRQLLQKIKEHEERMESGRCYHMAAKDFFAHADAVRATAIAERAANRCAACKARERRGANS